MKVTDMTREELRDHMKSNGEIFRYNSDSVSWKQAFKLAKLSGLEYLEMDCAKCVDKVKDFIEK